MARVARIRLCAAGWSVGLALLLAASATGCRAAFRLPVEPHDASRPASEVLLAGMNPFLLTDLLSDRVVVEVDRVAGLTVHPAALDGLRETLAEYVPGKTIEIRMDDEIPVDVWQSVPGDFLDRARALGPWVDGLGAGDESDLIYVVYVPDEPEYMGWATRLVLERDGRPWPVDTIVMFPATIGRGQDLWITARKIERAILIHELGHLLGLVSGPGHRERGNPRHCTEPQCVMTHPSGRSKTYNALPALFAGRIPHAYCNRCRDDIRTAQKLWRQAALAPGFAERLRTERRIETLRAEACWYGRNQRFSEAAVSLREARALAGEPDAGQVVQGEETLELLELCPAGES